MLKKDSEYIYEQLESMNATAPVSGLFTAFYPLVGTVDAVEPFATYALSQTSRATKDRIRSYSVDFTVVAADYDSVATATDLLQEYVTNNLTNFYFAGSTPSYIDEKGSCIVVTTYNFKIK